MNFLLMFSAHVVLCKYWIAVPLASVFAVAAQFVLNNKFSCHFGRSSDQFVWSFRDIFAGGSDLLSAYLTSAWSLCFVFLFFLPNALSVWSPRWSSVIAQEWRMKSSARRPLVAEKVNTRKFSCSRTCRMLIDRNVSVAEAIWRSHSVSRIWRISWRACSCASNDVRFSNREHPEPYGRGTTSALN